MDDTKVYGQTLKQLQSHLPFLSDIITKIKAKSETDQEKYLSTVEKLYHHANSNELKLEFMIKIEASIMKLKEKYELKIVDTATKKTSIPTIELIENAVEKDNLSDEASVHVLSDSSSLSPPFDRISSIVIPKSDKYRKDRHGSHNKSDRLPSDCDERYSYRYDQQERLNSRDRFKHDRRDSPERPCKSERYRHEHSHKHDSRQVKEENRDKSAGSSKNESIDVESGSETEIKCERSDTPSPVGRPNIKLVVNPISINKAFDRFGTNIVKVSSDERLTESDASELKARHSKTFGCESDNEDGLELKNLIDLKAKLLTQIAEREKRNKYTTTTSDLPKSELSKVSSTTPIFKNGLKFKLDLLKRRQASEECTSAVSTESGQKDSSKFIITETSNQTNKSTRKYSASSAKPLESICIDEDIIAKLVTQPINEKNNVTSSTSKDFTTAQNISDPWIMDVVKQALVTPRKTEEGKSNASEIAANIRERNSWNKPERLAYKNNRKMLADQHKQSEVPHSNNFIRSNDPRLSSVRDERVQPQEGSTREFSSSLGVPPSQGSYNMNGLAAHPGQQHTFPSTSQYRMQSRPHLTIKEPLNYNNQLPQVNSTDISPHNGDPLIHPVNCRLSLDSEKKNGSMTYGGYKLSQQAAVSSTSKKFNKNETSKFSDKCERNLQAVVSSTSEKFNKNRAQMTSGEYKRSEHTVISSTPEEFDEENVTSKSTTDLSKSHLDNIYRSGNFSKTPNLFVTGSNSDSGQKFKIPKKKPNDATKSNVIQSNEQSRGVKDLDDPNLSVSGSKSTTGNNFKISKKNYNGAAESSDIQFSGQLNISEVKDLYGPNLSVTGSKPNSGNNFKIPKKKPNGSCQSNDNHCNKQPNFREVKDLDDSESEVIGNGLISCDIEVSECRDPLKKKPVLDGKKMKESTSTVLSQSMELPKDVLTNSTSFLADNQLTVTQEDMDSMRQQFMNPNNLLTLMTLCAERSDDQMFSKIREIIQRSNATNQSSSREERTDGQSILVEAGKNIPKTPRRKNELEKLNEDMCSIYNKANKEPVAALHNLNTEKQQNRSKDDGAVVNQRTVAPPSNEARIMRRRNTMIDYNESSRRYMPPQTGCKEGKSRRPIHESTKTVESNGDDMNESPRVTQSRLTKECTVVLEKLHPDSLTSTASSKKDERGKRGIREIGVAQDIETGKKKRLSSHAVVKNNNPEWHCLKKRMECQLCQKTVGISSVSHYVNSHPSSEVFPCRVIPDVADFLRNSKEEHKVESIASKGSVQRKFKQRCYFCNETKSLLKTYWMQHVAVHTGYYQYKCTGCNRRFSSGSNNHSCKRTSKNKIVKETLPQLNKKQIFGYLCDLCNFVRFDETEMAKHLCCEHESNVAAKYKKVVFLRFPTKKMKRKIEPNTVEQIDTPDLDVKPHIDSFVESNSRKRSRRASNMNIDDTESEDHLQEEVRKKNEATKQMKTESLDPLICDEGISIVIKTQTDEDNLMEQNAANETPMEKPSSCTGASVRENNCTAPVTPQRLDDIIVKEEENRGPMESEIQSSSLSENEVWEPVNGDSTNNDVEIDNLYSPTSRVYNMGYTKSFDIMGNRKFSCLINLCGFETMHLDSLLSHIDDHTVNWAGFCFSCNDQIINNQVPLMMEFKHMTETHLNKIDDSDCDESGERKYSIKCIELSKLQEAEYAATAKQDAAASSSFVCENDFMKITDVTSLPVISNVVSLQANKPDQDPEEIVLKQWTRNPTSKLPSYCKLMMREVSMFALFKCMDVRCCFTTNNNEIMLNHLRNHEIKAYSQVNSFDANASSWLECAYCDEIGDSSLLLVEHIQQEHQSSIFQCLYCFYRSIAAYNVIVHMSQFHQSKEKLVLVCNGKTKGYATKKALFERSRKFFVRPLRCFGDCKKSTFVMDYFVQHMKSSPDHSKTFKCQFCGYDILITEAVKHLLCHRIGILECVYCHYGTNDIASIQKHMCNSHPSKLLYICARLTRKSQILTDEQLSLVDSTMIVDIGQPVDAKFFQQCPYSEQQLNFLSPSIDINSNISAATVAAVPIVLNQVPTAVEISGAVSMSNQTFFNADTLGLSNERDIRLMRSEVLSYEDFEKEYISDDYDKYFQSLPLSEKPSTPNCKRKSSAAPLTVGADDLERFEGFDGF